MSNAKLASIIETALIKAAPRGRAFHVTSTQLYRAAEAVLKALAEESPK